MLTTTISASYVCSLLALSGCAAALLGEAGSGSVAAHSDSDRAITSAVKSKLAANAEVKAQQVNVDTRQGLVHLSGEVHTTSQRATVERLAWQVTGVKSVKNELRVRGK